MRGSGNAITIVKIRRFQVWLCATWYLGYQRTDESFMLFLIPPFGIGWVGPYG